MNAAVDVNRDRLDVVTAERAFRMAYRHLFGELCSDEALQDREARALLENPQVNP
jgi:hypothetical protein